VICGLTTNKTFVLKVIDLFVGIFCRWDTTATHDSYRKNPTIQYYLLRQNLDVDMTSWEWCIRTKTVHKLPRILHTVPANWFVCCWSFLAYLQIVYYQQVNPSYRIHVVSSWLCTLLGPKGLTWWRQLPQCFWLTNQNDWSKWFAISSLPPICSPSFSLMGEVWKKVNK
jgi:hypothetical protein